MARDDSAGNGVHFGFFYCIHGYCIRGVETSVTVTATSTSSLRPIVVSIQAYRSGSFDPVLPVGDAGNTYALGAATGGLTSPSVSPIADKSEVLLFSAWAISGNTALTTTWSSPATELTDNRTYVSAASISWNHSIAYEQRNSAGGSLAYTATPSASVFQKIVAAIVINPTETATLVAEDDFNRTSLGSNRNTEGGGTLYISSNQLCGVGMPSEPMSYAFWHQEVDFDTQMVEAMVRWNGRTPGHSAVAVVVRANPSANPAVGWDGVQFWATANLMGILYIDPTAPDGFRPAIGTADYVSTSQFPDGAVMRLVARGTTYTAYLPVAVCSSFTLPSTVIRQVTEVPVVCAPSPMMA